MGKHESAMTAMRGKLTEARGLYEQAIAEANADRAACIKAYQTWENIAFPTDSQGRRRSGSARHPDHLTQMENDLSRKGKDVFELRDQVQLWRVRIGLLDRAHLRDEVSDCPSCGQAAAILLLEKDEDVRECFLCQHTQVRTVGELKWGVWPGHREAAVKWERKPRTKYYYG